MLPVHVAANRNEINTNTYRPTVPRSKCWEKYGIPERLKCLRVKRVCTKCHTVSTETTILMRSRNSIEIELVSRCRAHGALFMKNARMLTVRLRGQPIVITQWFAILSKGCPCQWGSPWKDLVRHLTIWRPGNSLQFSSAKVKIVFRGDALWDALCYHINWTAV